MWADVHVGMASQCQGVPAIMAGRALGIRGVKSQSGGGGCVHTDQGKDRQGALGKPVFGNYLSVQILYYVLMALCSFFTVFFTSTNASCIVFLFACTL